MRKKAFITGITGQDGSYLADLLLAKGYDVHGLVRSSSGRNYERIAHLLGDGSAAPSQIMLHDGDLTDAEGLMRLMKSIDPDEVYNLGGQSHVGMSFALPLDTADPVANGVVRLLEPIRLLGIKAKLYQASSSEMFGNAPAPQNEATPFSPTSPYGVAKAAAFNFVKNYRDSYGIFAVNGISYNHESSRRGETFVTRKITMGIARILAGTQDYITLGNLDARRDWGYAPEYVEAMWKMLHHPKADDYVIATGEAHSVREFLEEAFGYASIPEWERYIKIDPQYIRPNEAHHLIGDASRAKAVLGWEPKVKFSDLVRIMLVADCEKQGVHL